MRRLRELIGTIRDVRSNTEAIDRLPAAVDAIGGDVLRVQRMVEALTAGTAAARARLDGLRTAAAVEAANRAALAAVPRPALMSDLLVLEGSAAERLAVRRLTVGEPIDRPFRRWIGNTRCVSEDAGVRALWQRLLDLEAACGDVLHANPSTVLDVVGGTVSRGDGGTLRIALDANAASPPGDASAPAEPVVAVPRFTYDFPRAKLDNFGHWLVDCLPHVLALSMLAPQARFLLPAPVKRFHRSLLSLIGVAEQQIVPWEGEPFASGRLLVLESDGRIGGGRPLSALLQLRSLMAARAAGSTSARRRRIYVSRRDAGVKGAWISNEPDVEAVFRSRGFEVLVMSECPLDEQMRLFREAAVVAGVSGAGLTDIVFSPPGTHVIVLLSDRLIRWYAKPGRARAKWAGGVTERHLAALGDSPRFYAHLAAACEQVCHSFVSADEVPAGQLAAFVDDVLAQADPS